MSNLAVMPVILPAVAGVVGLFWWRCGTARRVAYALVGLAQLALALVLVDSARTHGPAVLGVGGWAAPFGIAIIVDRLSAIMLTLGAITALASMLYGFAQQPVRLEHPLRLPLVQFLVAGISLSFATADLFNLFVAFEVMLIASYALLTLEADDRDVKHALPYLTVNLVGGALFLGAAGLAYGLFGTLNFAGIAARASEMSGDPRVMAWAVLLLTVFAIKAGVFPLYYWLPNAYPILPAPIAALYSGMLTKVGVYVLLRACGTLLPHDLTGLHAALAWLAGLTMILGVLGAVSRNFIRGILSFHILSQIGFMVLAIGFFTEYAVAAAVFYIVHHIIVKSSLFMAGGVVGVLNRSDDLDRSANLWRTMPVVGLLFLLPALSLAGLPPLSGFWGKYMIVVEGVRQGHWVLVVLSLVASVLTLFSMLKIWNTSFWAEDPSVPVRRDDTRWRGMAAVTGGMVVLSLVIGLGAAPFMDLAFETAREVLDQEGYVRLVLGAAGGGAGMP
jgi:multicomponent Na+:H+ antiporter subunit D